MDGWIRIHDSLRGHWIWRRPEHLARWLDILFMAEPGGGTFTTTYGRLAGRWHVSKKTAFSFLRALASDGMIETFTETARETEAVTQITRVTVCECERYDCGFLKRETFTETARETAKRTPPCSPSLPPASLSPTPPIPLPPNIPPIIPQEKTTGCEDARTHVHAQGPAPPGEGNPPPTPSLEEDWRHPSSVRRASLGFDRDRIAEWKRSVIAARLAEVAPGIGMPPDEQEMFLRKWCEHNPGSDKIRAEWEDTFDVRSRAENWMAWRKRNGTDGRSAGKPKSRIEQYDEEIQRYHELKKQIYGTGDDPFGTSAGGLADLPDEQ